MKTTDPQDERFDLYDASGTPLGTSKPRGAVHRDGDWHRSLHLWVWGVDAGRSFVIFQRRSLTKDTWAGYLDVAVGGHFRSGESLADTLREAEEELGLAVTEADVVRLGRRFNAWRAETFHDCEINEVYAARSDQPLAIYRQHPEEIDELVQVGVNDTFQLFRREAQTVEAWSQLRSDAVTRRVRLRMRDFVDMSDGYALETLLSIGQLAEGFQPVPFTILAQD